MPRKKRHIIRIQAFLLAGAFFAQELSFAQGVDVLTPPGMSWQQISQNPSLFQAPLQFVSMKEVHKGTKDSLILLIEDAHANYSGQKNMADALDAIMTKYKVSLVLAEGGVENCSLDALKEVAPAQVWKRAGKTFLMEGKIAGEEYLNLISNHPMKIMGLEDMALYLNSVQAYAALTEKRDKNLRYLTTLENAVLKLKTKLYPEELLVYEKAVFNGTRTSDKNFEAAFKVLAEMANKNKVGLEEFPELLALINLQQKEKGIDFDKANLEQAALVEEIANKGGEAELKKRLEPTSQGSRSKIPQFTQFQNMLKLAQEKNIAISNYPTWAVYGDYLKEFADIDLDKVLDQTEKAEDKIYVALIASEAKQSSGTAQIASPASQVRNDMLLVRAIDRYLALLDNAYHIQMTTKDFEIFSQNEQDFGTLQYQAFINRKLAELGYFDALIPYEHSFEDDKQLLKEFYGSVNERDVAFLKNTKKYLDQEKQKVAVMITGGYHTPHLKKLLMAEGHSIAVLTPFVTSATNQAKYERELLAPMKKTLKKVTVGSDESYSRKKSKSVLDDDLQKLVNKKKSGVRKAAFWMDLNADILKGANVLDSDALAFLRGKSTESLSILEEIAKWPEVQPKKAQVIKIIDNLRRQISVYNDLIEEASKEKPAKAGARMAIREKILDARHRQDLLGMVTTFTEVELAKLSEKGLNDLVSAIDNQDTPYTRFDRLLSFLADQEKSLGAEPNKLYTTLGQLLVASNAAQTQQIDLNFIWNKYLDTPRQQAQGYGFGQTKYINGALRGVVTEDPNLRNWEQALKEFYGPEWNRAQSVVGESLGVFLDQVNLATKKVRISAAMAGAKGSTGARMAAEAQAVVAFLKSIWAEKELQTVYPGGVEADGSQVVFSSASGYKLSYDLSSNIKDALERIAPAARVSEDDLKNVVSGQAELTVLLKAKLANSASIRETITILNSLKEADLLPSDVVYSIVNDRILGVRHVSDDEPNTGFVVGYDNLEGLSSSIVWTTLQPEALKRLKTVFSIEKILENKIHGVYSPDETVRILNAMKSAGLLPSVVMFETLKTDKKRIRIYNTDPRMGDFQISFDVANGIMDSIKVALFGSRLAFGAAGIDGEDFSFRESVQRTADLYRRLEADTEFMNALPEAMRAARGSSSINGLFYYWNRYSADKGEQMLESIRQDANTQTLTAAVISSFEQAGLAWNRKTFDFVYQYSAASSLGMTWEAKDESTWPAGARMSDTSGDALSLLPALPTSIMSRTHDLKKVGFGKQNFLVFSSRLIKMADGRIFFAGAHASKLGVGIYDSATKKTLYLRDEAGVPLISNDEWGIKDAAMDKDENIYVVNQWGRMWIYNKAGELTRSVQLGAGRKVEPTAIIVSDNTVIYADLRSGDIVFFNLETNSEQLAVDPDIVASREKYGVWGTSSLRLLINPKNHTLALYSPYAFRMRFINLETKQYIASDESVKVGEPLKLSLPKGHPLTRTTLTGFEVHDSRIYIGDQERDAVHIFETSGGYVGSLPTRQLPAQRFGSHSTISVGRDGNLLVGYFDGTYDDIPQPDINRSLVNNHQIGNLIGAGIRGPIELGADESSSALGARLSSGNVIQVTVPLGSMADLETYWAASVGSALAVPVPDLPALLKNYLEAFTVDTLSGKRQTLFEYLSEYVDEVIFTPPMIRTDAEGNIAQLADMLLHPNNNLPGKRVVYISLARLIDQNGSGVSHQRQLSTSRVQPIGEVDAIQYIADTAAQMEVISLVREGLIDPQHYDLPQLNWLKKLGLTARLRILEQLPDFLLRLRPESPGDTFDFVDPYTKEVRSKLGALNESLKLPTDDFGWDYVKRPSSPGSSGARMAVTLDMLTDADRITLNQALGNNWATRYRTVDTLLVQIDAELGRLLGSRPEGLEVLMGGKWRNIENGIQYHPLFDIQAKLRGQSPVVSEVSSDFKRLEDTMNNFVSTPHWIRSNRSGKKHWTNDSANSREDRMVALYQKLSNGDKKRASQVVEAAITRLSKLRHSEETFVGRDSTTRAGSQYNDWLAIQALLNEADKSTAGSVPSFSDFDEFLYRYDDYMHDYMVITGQKYTSDLKSAFQKLDAQKQQQILANIAKDITDDYPGYRYYKSALEAVQTVLSSAIITVESAKGARMATATTPNPFEFRTPPKIGSRNVWERMYLSYGFELVASSHGFDEKNYLSPRSSYTVNYDIWTKDPSENTVGGATIDFDANGEIRSVWVSIDENIRLGNPSWRLELGGGIGVEDRLRAFLYSQSKAMTIDMSETPGLQRIPGSETRPEAVASKAAEAIGPQITVTQAEAIVSVQKVLDENNEKPLGGYADDFRQWSVATPEADLTKKIDEFIERLSSRYVQDRADAQANKIINALWRIRSQLAGARMANEDAKSSNTEMAQNVMVSRPKITPLQLLPTIAAEHVERLRQFVNPIAIQPMGGQAVFAADSSQLSGAVIYFSDGTYKILADENGEFLTKKTVKQSAVAENGTIYVATASDSKIRAYTAEGNYLASYSIPLDKARPLNVQGMAVFDGNLFYSIADLGELRVLNLETQEERRFGGPDVIGPFRMTGSMNMAIDKTNHMVYVFNQGVPGMGSPFLQIRSFDIAKGLYSEPMMVRGLGSVGGIAFRDNGDIYISDTDRNILHVVSSKDGYKGAISLTYSAHAINFDDDGNLYAAGHGHLNRFAARDLDAAIRKPEGLNPEILFAAKPMLPANEGARLADQFGKPSKKQLASLKSLTELDFLTLSSAMVAEGLEGGESYAIHFKNGVALVEAKSNTVVLKGYNPDGSAGDEIGRLTLTDEQVEAGRKHRDSLRGVNIEKVLAGQKLPDLAVASAQQSNQLLRMTQNGDIAIVNVIAEDLMGGQESEWPAVEAMIKANLEFLKSRGIYIRFIDTQYNTPEKYKSLSSANELPAGEYPEILLASAASVRQMTVTPKSGLIVIQKKAGQIIPILPTFATAADVKRNQQFTDKDIQRMHALTGRKPGAEDMIRFQTVPADFNEQKEAYLKQYEQFIVRLLDLTLQQITRYAELVKAVSAAA